MNVPARIGIIGDFNPENVTHVFTNVGIKHAAEALGTDIEAVWLPTDQAHDFEKFNGLFCSPGSPYKSLEGALAGIRCARERNIPFLGTCGGCQHLVLEFARNVMRIADAAHAETDPYASRLFITPLSCSLVGRTMEVCIAPGSLAALIYQSNRCFEQYYCNFGINPAYTQDMKAAGLAITGSDTQGEVRIVEILGDTFCIGTLFVPQASSQPGTPHPILVAFCRAAIERRLAGQ